jgi:hypothetical protein
VTDVPDGVASIAHGETPVGWRNIALGSVAFFLAMPAVLGGLGSVIPALLHPDGRLPAVTRFDHAVISIFTWSVVLAWLSLPATILAVILGAWAAKRAGWKTAFSRTLLAVVVAAIVLSAASYGLGWMSMQRHPEFRHGIPAR